VKRASQVEGHEEFVVVEAVLFEGAEFEAVLGEAEGLVEADGGNVGADDGELELFDAGAGGVNDGLDEEVGGAGAAVRGADVHGAEPAFVGFLGAGVLAKGGDADELGAVEGAEDLGGREPAGVFFKGSGLFGFEGAPEGFGVEAESFETDFAEGLEIRVGELADDERHDYR